MSNFFNKELLYRIVSILIFIPVVIFPLFHSNLLSIIIYLIIISIILIEISDMKKKVEKVLSLNIYYFISIASFFLFLFLLITEKYSDYFLLGIIIIIWLFDTFSYIGGKVIGGMKLMPKISSGKTVSGLITGVIMTLLASEIFKYFSSHSYDHSTVITIFIIFLSFFGDTIVSLLKRHASIKDSGSIMPGHGGLLDRFDSFIMVFFILGSLNLIK
jgi:phosphatidate cytidylyltransferase